MTRPLDAIGTVKYGDFTFPAPISLKVQVRPEYDASGRVVKWRTYHVQLEAVLVGDDFPGAGSIPSLSSSDPLDKSNFDAMRILRRQLSTPALNLQIIQQGLGQDLNFTSQNVVGYGPKPTTLVWEPLGSRQACRVVWTCEVSAIECGTAVLGVYSSGNPGEFTYTVNFGIAEDGLSTRSINGMIEVNPLRMGTRNIDRTADQLRVFITRNIPPLLNFSRTQDYRLTEDRRFLHFSIVDKENESENPLYPYVVRADIEQRISVTQHHPDWKFAFSGRILVAPGQPREIAWAAFVTAIKPRIQALKTRQDTSGNPSDYAAGKNDLALHPYRIDITEKIIGGREMSFNLAFIAVTSLKTIFKTSGLWLPVPGNWNAWQTSMIAGGPHDPRGIAQLGHSYQQERIYSFCISVPSVPAPPPLLPYQRKPRDVPVSDEILGPPPKAKSWYQYELRLTILKGNQTILSRRLGSPDSTAKIVLDAGERTIRIRGKGYTPADDLVIQDRGVSDYRVVLVGTARRAGHTIRPEDIAVIETINGQKAQAIGDTVLPVPHKDRRMSGLYPMYVARWKYTYALPSSTATIVLGKHPDTREGLGP